MEQDDRLETNEESLDSLGEDFESPHPYLGDSEMEEGESLSSGTGLEELQRVEIESLFRAIEEVTHTGPSKRKKSPAGNRTDKGKRKSSGSNSASTKKESKKATASGKNKAKKKSG